jgi:hypothetical protein
MKKKISIIIITFLILSIISGCIDLFKTKNEDPIIVRARPYLDKIEVNNTYIRDLAYSILTNNRGSKESIINTIYRFIIDNYDYISDPDDIELIKTPFETIEDGGGDCEDLTILINSILENIGIKTYLAMNETHAYSLVCDVDTELMWEEIEKSFIKIVEDKWGEKIKRTYNEEFILNSREICYYGGNGTYFDEFIDYINISYDIKSERPINLYLVPSVSDFENLSNNEEFYQFFEYNENNIIKTKNHFSYGDRFGGIILQNNKYLETKIIVNITFYFHPNFYEYYKNNSIKTYNINETNCIVIDCTLGEWGYPGYDSGIKGEKIAISKLNYEYFYLYN